MQIPKHRPSIGGLPLVCPSLTHPHENANLNNCGFGIISSAANLIRAGYTAHNVHHKAALTVGGVLNGLLSSEMESTQTKTRACFILCEYYIFVKVSH